MKHLRDLPLVLLTAGITAVFAHGLLSPVVAGADDPPAIVPAIDGVRFTASFDRAEYEPGQELVLTLIAESTLDREKELTVLLRLDHTEPMVQLTRIGPRSRTIWTDGLTLSLEPGEKREVVLRPGRELAAVGDLGFFVSGDGMPLPVAAATVKGPPDAYPRGGPGLQLRAGNGQTRDRQR